MKQVIKKTAYQALFAFAFLYSVHGYSQKTFTADSSVSKLSDSNWIFTASFVLPQKGRTGPVSGYYTVTYRNHILNVSLPYYGEAYGGADIFPGKNPLDFSSADFNVKTSKIKKGGSAILFKPNDYSEVSSMNFVWYHNGRSNLDIILANRSGISFTGSVRFL